MTNYPAWLGTLSVKEEKLRAHHGLFPGIDGWYKTVDSRRRYIARRVPLEHVVAILPHRIDELRGLVAEKQTSLATTSTSIEELVEMFLAHLWHRVQTGQPRKMSRYTYDDYLDVLSRFCECVGPRQPAIGANATWFTAFARANAKKAATTRRREMIYIKAFFKWAGPGEYSMNFYPTPVKFGAEFVKPDESTLRAGRSSYDTAYTQEKIETSLQAAAVDPKLYAAGLLALNCAFIPVDVITIPFKHLDLDAGTHDFPRGKNGLPRKAHLMPETVAALRHYIEDWRPPRKSEDEPIFVGDDGEPYGQHRKSGPEDRVSRTNPLAQYWSFVTGLPFKGLRTTFATEADDAVDQVAVDLVMGHAAKSVRSVYYVKRFDVARLKAVVELVWRRVGPSLPRPSVAMISASRLRRMAFARRATASTPPTPRAGSGSGPA